MRNRAAPRNTGQRRVAMRRSATAADERLAQAEAMIHMTARPMREASPMSGCPKGCLAVG